VQNGRRTWIFDKLVGVRVLIDEEKKEEENISIGEKVLLKMTIQ